MGLMDNLYPVFLLRSELAAVYTLWSSGLGVENMSLDYLRAHLVLPMWQQSVSTNRFRCDEFKKKVGNCSVMGVGLPGYGDE